MSLTEAEVHHLLDQSIISIPGHNFPVLQRLECLIAKSNGLEQKRQEDSWKFCDGGYR